MLGSVDIRKWLEETVQPEAPREPVRLEQTVEPAKRKRRRKSDSSILNHRPPASSLNESVGDSVDEAIQATCSDSPSSSRYARKPRRKTRPERYEPGPHARRDHKGESKRTLRKPRRKKGEKPPAVMQTFQAKNVSRDRLTLKPREHLGLFNKGRTSTAINGRGLPDLVFSEMKFLRKHKDEPESVPRSDLPKRKGKKDHVQTKEGEISAFFTSVRPVLVEKNSNSLPEHAASRTRRHGRDHPSVSETARLTVEVADPASYLGFGSRGPRHDSTSYVSWSESVRAPSTTPAQVRNRPVRHSLRDKDSYGKTDTRKEGERDIFKLPARPPSATKQRTDRTPADAFRLSSLAPSHSRASRSQSFPPHSSYPQQPNLIDRSAKLQDTDDTGSPSSMPPFTPAHVMDVRCAQPRSSSKDAKSGVAPASGAPAIAESRQHGQPSEDSPVGQVRIPTSSDLGLVLQQCNDKFYQRRHCVGPRRRHTEQMHPAYPQSDLRQNTTHLYGAAQQVPTVRFADQLYHGPILPNFAGPSIYEQQARRQQLPLQLGIEEDPLHSLYIDPDHLGQDDPTEYDDLAWEGLPDEHRSYSLESDMYMYDEVGSFTEGADKRVQDLRQENDTVAPGFWRPNKLY